MIIKSIMTDEDRKALEYMLSLEYAMPYQLLKTKNNRRKIIYIMTPVLFLLSIGCYFVKSYPMFYVEMGISIIALIWIIWFQSKGKKFENSSICYTVCEPLGSEGGAQISLLCVNEEKI